MFNSLIDRGTPFFQRYFPLTALGVFILAMSIYLSQIYAYEHKDRILFIFLILPIFFGILTLLLYIEVYRIRRFLKAYTQLDPLEAEVDQDVLTLNISVRVAKRVNVLHGAQDRFDHL